MAEAKMAATVDVLVVDDSLLMQRITTRLLESDPGIRVVATAADGYEAIEKVLAFHPDVVTMDIQMPRLDGLAALQQIMQRMPTPVVMLSGVEDATAVVRALQSGAVEFVAKPSGTVSIDLHRIRDELIAKVKIATLVNLERAAAQMALPVPCLESPDPVSTNHPLVAIGASTGGVQALDRICRQLPASLPASLLIVQHMPATFTTSFAQRLDHYSPLRIVEAQHGEAVQLGAAYLAPGGQHMVIRSEGGRATIHLLDTPPVNSVRPSADVLMASVASEAGSHCVGVVLTGMGKDGTEGLARVKQAGGTTLAQDRESCVVFGMPKAAIDRGVVDQVLPLAQIPAALVQILGKGHLNG
jgi:two-component system, chemotaxis family, protein-glutamate methylesterase/glutaminase